LSKVVSIFIDTSVKSNGVRHAGHNLPLTLLTK